MVSIQKAQTGNKVYRGVGTSPNLGPVSGKGASGYIQRELRKKPPIAPVGPRPPDKRGTQGPLKTGFSRPVGGDGKSDSRSGVAARSLARSANASAPGFLPAATQKGTSQIPSENASNSGMTNAAEAAATPPPQQVQASPVGALQLPYDQSYSAEQVALVTQANQDLLDLQMEEQENDMQFTTATRDADLAYKALQKQMLSGAGGRGTVFSSMYGSQVGDSAGQYSNQLADLTSKNALFKSGAAQRRAAIQTSLSSQIQALTQQYAAELAAKQAGELGFGTDPGSVAAGAPAPAAPAPSFEGSSNYSVGTGWGTVNAQGGGGGDRGPRPSANHVWRDGRWIPWSQTAAGKRGEKQPKD